MKVKYPRTFHLPWSPGVASDDKMHSASEIEAMFSGQEVVVTEKLDGENTTIYANGETHARSLDSAGHASRDFVRGKAQEIGYAGLPAGYRLMGENLFAQHSIAYDALADFFVLFGVADEKNTALSWDEVCDWAALIGIPVAPVLYRGNYDEKVLRGLYPFQSRMGTGVAEGYVVRLACSFPMDSFEESVAKFVRKNHVQTDEHWMSREVIPNKRR